MIRLPDQSLPADACIQLGKWQGEIDCLSDFDQKVDQGKRKFAQYNRKNNATFDSVKGALTSMCCGAQRCMYCEDSAAHQVEHMMPKSLYPNKIFVWDNYAYACGPCNGPKNNNFAVVAQTSSGASIEEVNKSNIASPPTGDPALINPRIEDPLRFFYLDLKNTFRLSIALRLTKIEELRAEYTCQVLNLNRDYLTNSRSEAFGSYRARLREYIQDKENGAPQSLLDRHIAELKRMYHKTVWKEMQRQRQHYATLNDLFSRAPEALNW